MEYKEVVKLIEESEKRVDEVLKAARLQRHERQPMPKEKLELILNYALWVIALILGSGAVYMYIYFMCTGGK